MTNLEHLKVETWLNTSEPVSLTALRGRVVVVEAFQMLCPGCVSHGLPQAQRVHRTFSREHVVVLGLHSVFEHHQAQGVVSLKAFLHEYRVPFPVAVDAPSEQGRLPQTMSAFQFGGTPTLLLFDKNGALRKQTLGEVPDMVLGSEIMSLIKEGDGLEPNPISAAKAAKNDGATCTIPTDGGK